MESCACYVLVLLSGLVLTCKHVTEHGDCRIEGSYMSRHSYVSIIGLYIAIFIYLRLFYTFVFVIVFSFDTYVPYSDENLMYALQRLLDEYGWGVKRSTKADMERLVNRVGLLLPQTPEVYF